MFIGRESELQYLNDAYRSDKAEFIVLYGRRRVGKTELLNEFCKDKTAIFYTCREYTDAKQLQSFTDKVHSYNIPAFEYVDCFPVGKRRSLLFFMFRLPAKAVDYRRVPVCLQGQ